MSMQDSGRSPLNRLRCGTAVLGPLFKAYVTDITDRRGCTDVKLPRESDYRD
ncbi:hypothetical protein ABT033_20040 [Streptomyces pharetrae]|uniref:hypothetical protein n=1 Tax=Streptomyces pharetrae TaxID=291370 RepID=UPI0033479768